LKIKQEVIEAQTNCAAKGGIRASRLKFLTSRTQRARAPRV
jgi:hypothetical protein